ncbi:GD17760 [Drosophila simulans]|uniref:GD17760 n=1 Tax=Drosophila simulans TaxID=7240 RepID=B4R1G5_DROSI|nr:GD17760 [Drosophila simulans]
MYAFQSAMQENKMEKFYTDFNPSANKDVTQCDGHPSIGCSSCSFPASASSRNPRQPVSAPRPINVLWMRRSRKIRFKPATITPASTKLNWPLRSMCVSFRLLSRLAIPAPSWVMPDNRNKSLPLW